MSPLAITFTIIGVLALIATSLAVVFIYGAFKLHEEMRQEEP